jgi:tRNA(Leu) C34 or U34 (ribose-2'-O)-methylase TrmL
VSRPIGNPPSPDGAAATPDGTTPARDGTAATPSPDPGGTGALAPARATGDGADGDADPAGVGVGPHLPPWPDDPRLDPELLAGGDRRNVVDRYRYWRVGAIVADLDTRRHPFHVAVENWGHDLNIGTVVRNANAFLAAAVHIVGRRRWNRRGAMVTDRYQHVVHHGDVEALAAWAEAAGLPLVGIDNQPGSTPLEASPLPQACVLLFGQEGPGLSPAAHAACTEVRSIAMFGSTRSINAGVASGIAMHAWVTAHAL